MGLERRLSVLIRLDIINKAKQAKQKWRTGSVVRHAYIEDECDVEWGHRTGVNALVEQGSGSGLQAKLERQEKETQDLVKQQNVLLQKQTTMLNETLTRLEDSLRTLASGSKGRYGSETIQKLFDPYPGEKKRVLGTPAHPPTWLNAIIVTREDIGPSCGSWKNCFEKFSVDHLPPNVLRMLIWFDWKNFSISNKNHQFSKCNSYSLSLIVISMKEQRRVISIFVKCQRHFSPWN